MRYWIDTEFIEDGKTIELISIGIVAEDGRQYYGISLDFDPERASDWVRENVLCLLPPRRSSVWKSLPALRQEVIQFMGVNEFQVWGYYSDYDWVLLCQTLFGPMIALPKNWPKYCLDVKQLAYHLGNPRLPEQLVQEHDALADALWIRLAWEFLRDRAEQLHGPIWI